MDILDGYFDLETAVTNLLNEAVLDPETYGSSDLLQKLKPGVEDFIVAFHTSLNQHLLARKIGDLANGTMIQFMIAKRARERHQAIIEAANERIIETMHNLAEPLATLIEVSDWTMGAFVDQEIAVHGEVDGEKAEMFGLAIYMATMHAGHQFIQRREIERDDCTVCIVKPSEHKQYIEEREDGEQ